MRQKHRKQVSLEFLDYTKNTINELLKTKIDQKTKRTLCILMEKLLGETKKYDGYRHLYWSRYGHLDWDTAKKQKFYPEIPQEFIVGPDFDGSLDFVSDIQGEFSRFYP